MNKRQLEQRVRPVKHSQPIAEISLTQRSGFVHISLYLRGPFDLSKGVRAAIEGHALTCPQCQQSPSRRRNSVVGTGRAGLTITINPKDFEHWIRILTGLLGGPDALIHRAGSSIATKRR